MLKRLGVFIGGLVCGAALTLILSPYTPEILRLRSRQYWQYLMKESRQAAEARRQELREQLATFSSHD